MADQVKANCCSIKVFIGCVSLMVGTVIAAAVPWVVLNSGFSIVACTFLIAVGCGTGIALSVVGASQLENNVHRE